MTAPAASIPSLLIEGKTYMYRREIKALGGKWNPDLEGWTVPAQYEAAVGIIATKAANRGESLTISPVDVPAEAYRKLEGEELREARQARADRIAARLEGRAEKKQAAADRAYDAAHRIADMIPLGQPILVGHHSEGRHRRDLDRIHRGYEKAGELSTEAHRLKQRSVSLRGGVRVAGDAEKRHQDHRDAITAIARPGVVLFCPIYGNLEVLKVNTKTLRVKGRFGDFNVDKSLFNLPERKVQP